MGKALKESPVFVKAPAVGDEASEQGQPIGPETPLHHGRYEEPFILIRDGQRRPVDLDLVPAQCHQGDGDRTEERAGIWLNRAYDLALGLDPEFPGPLIGPYRQVRNIIGDSLDRMMLNGADPADVIAEADAEINDAIDDYNEENF